MRICYKRRATINTTFLESLVRDFDLEDVFVYNHKTGETFSLGKIPFSKDAIITTVQEFLKEIQKINQDDSACKGCIEFSDLTACYFMLPQYPEYFFVVLSRRSEINLHAIIYQIIEYLESI